MERFALWLEPHPSFRRKVVTPADRKPGPESRLDPSFRRGDDAYVRSIQSCFVSHPYLMINVHELSKIVDERLKKCQSG